MVLGYIFVVLLAIAVLTVIVMGLMSVGDIRRYLHIRGM
ncbi:DUF6893 family small protein [Fodinicola feengrottensis]